MKKITLSIIYFVACTFYLQSQVLYSTTANGGPDANGTIIKFMPGSNDLGVVNSFGAITWTYGSNPIGPVTQALDGKFYGMTNQGGSNGVGVIYSFDPSTLVYSKLFDFGGSNGESPYGSLMQASNGKIYGMTTYGGSNGYGVMFSFDPNSSSFTKLFDFNNADNGANPTGAFIQPKDGKLYGMTAYGGIHSCGTIFSFDPVTSTFARLKDFDTIDGVKPVGSLMQAKDGKFYGMTFGGGSIGWGVIFSFDPFSLTYTKLKDFDFTDGFLPYGNLTQASDGKFYGMTWGGGAVGGSQWGYGVIFSYDPVTKAYRKLKDLDYAGGCNPEGSFIQASDGKLYGLTYLGGNYGAGVIFSVDPTTSAYTKLKDFDYSNGANPYYGSAFIELKECVADTTYYKDNDSDGYGNLNDSLKSCNRPTGYVRDHTDCDDNNVAVHPGATEICGNGIDDNCNGQIDENCQVGVTVSINNVTVKESKGVAVLTVTLSGKSSKPVWLLYYTKDGTATSRGWHKDYETRIGWLYIRPGSLSANIYIKIIKDRIAEPTEYFDVILFKSLNTIIADGSGRVFISDDDKPCNNSKIEFMQDNEISAANGLDIKVTPNPSASQFNITTASNDRTSAIDIRVMDVQGKLIDSRDNLRPGQVIQIGNNYRPGTYFIQGVQEKRRVTTTVVKL